MLDFTVQRLRIFGCLRLLVAVIGDSEVVLGAIESCKNRLEFVHLDAIPERAELLVGPSDQWCGLLRT